MRVDFDTGSTNTWIVRTCNAEGDDGLILEDCYDPVYSSSAVQLKEGSSIKFGKGELKGPWGIESLWIGD